MLNFTARVILAYLLYLHDKFKVNLVIEKLCFRPNYIPMYLPVWLTIYKINVITQDGFG